MRKKLCILTLLGSLGFAVGCGSSGSTPSGVPGGGGTTANVLSIAVDGGPTANQPNGIYPNGAFATVTICVPGSSSNCATVNHMLVDTGSVGVRVLQSAVSALSLPTVNANDGSAAWECVSFVDGSLLWGPVEAATVTMAGETASSVPIQVVASSSSNIPSSCSGLNENTVASLGANGILGVGLEPVDCPACDPSETSTPIVPAYYSCSSSPCTSEFMNFANQVTNPVASLAVDNNGVLIELPSVSSSAATVTGSLIFGIGTESNNTLSSTANYFNLCDDLFDTIFEGQTLGVNPTSCTGPGSFIDSGSNALFFPNVSAITVCTGNLSEWYCPSSLLSLSATLEDPTNSFESTVSFGVDNAQNLFTNSSTASNAAFTNLAGPVPSGSGFDWGLPFFYGRNVYTGIDQAGLGIGQQTPFWAYF